MRRAEYMMVHSVLFGSLRMMRIYHKPLPPSFSTSFAFELSYICSVRLALKKGISSGLYNYCPYITLMQQVLILVLWGILALQYSSRNYIYTTRGELVRLCSRKQGQNGSPFSKESSLNRLVDLIVDVGYEGNKLGLRRGRSQAACAS